VFCTIRTQGTCSKYQLSMPSVASRDLIEPDITNDTETNLASTATLILHASVTARYGVSLHINQECKAGYCVCTAHLLQNTAKQSQNNNSKLICRPQTRYVTQNAPESRCPVHGL
jgi:hypothetical protein